MNVGDILIILAVAVLLFLAWRRTKKHPTACSGNCAECSKSGHCGRGGK